MKTEFGSAWRKLCGWVNGEPTHDPEIYMKKAQGHQHSQKQHVYLNEEQLTERESRRFLHIYHTVAVLVCLSIASILMLTVFRLPLFGAPNNPASNEVVKRYIEKCVEETGAVNFVTGMILDYRAFDTFGESSVLFLAITSVLMLLSRDKNNIHYEEDIQTAHELYIEREMQDVILQKVILMVMPCILLFGIYVVLNGHISPGGGFSGGAIMGAGLIVYGASFGIPAVRKFFTKRTFKVITSTALLTYACSKAYAFFTGANNLPSGIPLGVPGALFSSGLIFVLDLCVGAVVACTMYGFYALFARGRL
ncbi:MAG: hydrogen gas-evolving membrane-bound hydrogenase subunit E [Clostridia bacterium]